MSEAQFYFLLDNILSLSLSLSLSVFAKNACPNAFCYITSSKNFLLVSVLVFIGYDLSLSRQWKKSLSKFGLWYCTPYRGQNLRAHTKDMADKSIQYNILQITND